MTHQILSLDPGTSNFGFAVIRFERQAFRMVKCGMISDTLKEVKDPTVLAQDTAAYVKRVTWLLQKAKPTHVGAERYIPRHKGISNEAVNMMLGYLIATAVGDKTPVNLFLASTWKLRVKKFLDLEAIYKAVAHVAPDHVVDAVFIGLYTAEKNGWYSLAKLSTARQQALLCKAITATFKDFRTSVKAVKHRSGSTRARSRKNRRKS